MRRFVLAFCSAALLGIAVGSAPAYGYTADVSPAGEISLASLGKLTFEGGGWGIRCNFTFSGELLSSAELIASEVLGEINEVGIGACENGSWRLVLALPWTISVTAILGTLPSAMTGLLLTIDDFLLQLAVFGGFVNCLWGGDLGALMAVSGSNPYTSGLLSILSRVLPKVSGALCPESIGVSGTLALSPEQTITVS